MVLSTDDITLRTTEWEELLPRGEGHRDIDAIYKPGKGKGKRAPSANAKATEVFVVIPLDKYHDALERHERNEVTQVCRYSNYCNQLSH
jgi:hypothetical protein